LYITSEIGISHYHNISDGETLKPAKISQGTECWMLTNAPHRAKYILPKIWQSKNIKFSARFGTTSRLDREYFRTATRYRQSENGVAITEF